MGIRNMVGGKFKEARIGGLYDTAKELLSRGMDVAEVADIVGIDTDNLEENFGELIAREVAIS